MLYRVPRLRESALLGQIHLDRLHDAVVGARTCRGISHHRIERVGRLDVLILRLLKLDGIVLRVNGRATPAIICFDLSTSQAKLRQVIVGSDG